MSFRLVCPEDVRLRAGERRYVCPGEPLSMLALDTGNRNSGGFVEWDTNDVTPAGEGPGVLIFTFGWSLVPDIGKTLLMPSAVTNTWGLTWELLSNPGSSPGDARRAGFWAAPIDGPLPLGSAGATWLGTFPGNDAVDELGYLLAEIRGLDGAGPLASDRLNMLYGAVNGGATSWTDNVGPFEKPDNGTFVFGYLQGSAIVPGWGLPLTAFSEADGSGSAIGGVYLGNDTDPDAVWNLTRDHTFFVAELRTP
jgi:hypothetical protein